MNCSTQGLPVHHQLLEYTQTHLHRVGDAIQPPHSLLSPSPPTFNLSQHQDLFKCVSSLHQVAKVLELQLQYQSFQWIFRVDFLLDELVGSPCCPRNSQELSPAPQFRSINSSEDFLLDLTIPWLCALPISLVASPCSPRDSQESSLAPQFKSINSSVLSFPYGPTLTSIHDYWKNHSFD